MKLEIEKYGKCQGCLYNSEPINVIVMDGTTLRLCGFCFTDLSRLPAQATTVDIG